VKQFWSLKFNLKMMKRASTSFPRHSSHWASILGLKWHICNSTALGGVFINIKW